MNQFIPAFLDQWLHDHQTILGYILVGCGTLLLALSGIAKGKGDKISLGRGRDENTKQQARSKRRKYYICYAFMLIFGILINVFGTWLTKHSGEEASKKQLSETTRILKETKEENGRALQAQREQDERTVRELREERQSILIALNAAKREDSKKITEEKIHVIQSDFAAWAENFATNLPSKRSEFTQLKTEFQKSQIEKNDKEIQRQKQLSGQAFPAISFAIRFLEESVRAYSKQARKDIPINPMELPENFYGKQTATAIQYSEKATWRLMVNTSSGPRGIQYSPEQLPYFKITFIDNQGSQSGTFIMRPNMEAHKLALYYETSVPTPETGKITGEYEINDYEGTIRGALQRIIENQILQLEQ